MALIPHECYKHERKYTRNVRKPSHNIDAANKVYVDENIITKVSKSGDRMSGDLNMDDNRITGLSTSLPTSSSDAVSWLQAVNLVRESEQETTSKVNRTGDVMTADPESSIGDNDISVRLYGSYTW